MRVGPCYAGCKSTTSYRARRVTADFNAGNADIYVRFLLDAPDHAPYMAHCHILEHEDSGMMTEFSVG
jgi:FtsP/CotA-like multicopper oxidase with cupredoxin domain